MSSDGSLALKQYDKYRQTIIKTLKGSDREGKQIPPYNPANVPKDWPKDLPLLRDKELNHILYGDKKGGGHLYGHGWVHSRNEFNESLKAAHIIEALKNNALPLEQLKAEFEKDDKTSIKREATYNGVDFYIVYSLKTDKQTREAIYKIITAYPKK